MAKSSTAMELRQEDSNPWRESLEQGVRDRMREFKRYIMVWHVWGKRRRPTKV